MNRLTTLLAGAMLIACASCNYSKHPIDSKPVVKVDEGLYGIWKVKNDTDKRNFILIQDGTEDGFKRTDIEHEYFITYYNGGGVNRGLENFDAHMSDVGGTKFVNVGYTNWENGKLKEHGYLIFKILKINDDRSKITMAIFDDPELQKLGSSKEVRERVLKQMNNANLYPETSELYSVAKGHFTKKEAVKRANQ